MESVKFCRSASAGGCVTACGVCPSCAFAAGPPGSVRTTWRLSDEFKRRFLVELLSRCRDVKVLESVQRVLCVTSWTLPTYVRCRSRTGAQDYRCLIVDRVRRGGKPVGLDLKEVWDWFSSSSDWLQLRYLYRLFALCEPDLLRMVANLTSVLLVRQKRGFLQSNAYSRTHHEEDGDEDSVDPVLLVVPGSFMSVSGVSRYRDFISCLHVDLSKRIFGLLDEQTLRLCQKVCRYWKHLAQETMEELKLARKFQDKIDAIMKRSKGFNIISPTYAKIVEVPVPENDGHDGDQTSVHTVRLFEAAYAQIKTKTVPMEERNVYCGAFFTAVLLHQKDPNRVMDYRGGSLMATGSKDRVVQLLHVASETKPLSVLKGHGGGIHAVLLCEERDLVITASWDTSIRCWDLKTDACLMILNGHTGAVTCLDVHADKLVSGAKDGLVKVWSLQTGGQCEDSDFKHQNSVQCVKINTTTVYSSCNRGLVKVWDMETVSLVRVIDAHKSAVKCLFVDQWYLLSGDSGGHVMAWSTSCDVKESLMTFSHPKEVRSVTLLHLRVITGCVDGRIRIFNFLTGDCLREIKTDAESGRLLSLHFHHDSILVNASFSVKRYQFAKVFWDNVESAEEGKGDEIDQDGVGAMKPSGKVDSANRKKPERSELPDRLCLSSSPTKCRRQARERSQSAKESVTLSEKAATERMKKRGLHHPLTRDSILLRVAALQRERCTDQVSINMENNARLRDSWGPHTSETRISLPKHTCDIQLRRPKTCVPILKRPGNQNMTNTTQDRQQAQNAEAHRRANRVSTTVTDRREAPEGRLMIRSFSYPECTPKTSSSPPMISPERTGFAPRRSSGRVRSKN